MLEDFGIHYRAKFSGHRSLHFILPAESMPESFRKRLDREKWRDNINKVGKFVLTRSNSRRFWNNMGTCGVCSAPYTAHRFVGLVSIPLIPADYPKFRPWMATVHLAEPVPNWWNIPNQAGENFQKLIDYIESDREVFDLPKNIAMEIVNEKTNHPILVIGEYGLGKVAVFLTCYSRGWADNLKEWSSFNQLWNNLIQWLTEK